MRQPPTCSLTTENARVGTDLPRSTACFVVSLTFVAKSVTCGRRRASELPSVCTNCFFLSLETKSTMSKRDLLVPFVFPFDTVERVPPCPCALHCAISLFLGDDDASGKSRRDSISLYIIGLCNRQVDTILSQITRRSFGDYISTE